MTGFSVTRLTIVTMAIFSSSITLLLFATSPITQVWAAVINCGFSGRCNGTEGDDNMKGGAGLNDMFGLGGNDRMSAGDHIDELLGGEGNDILSGDKGGDALQGENGNDTLFGGAEGDLFNGGPGADSFKCGPGINDRIEDFNASQGDTKSNDCEIIFD